MGLGLTLRFFYPPEPARLLPRKEPSSYEDLKERYEALAEAGREAYAVKKETVNSTELEEDDTLSEQDRLDHLMVNDPVGFEQAMIDLEKA